MLVIFFDLDSLTHFDWNRKVVCKTFATKELERISAEENNKNNKYTYLLQREVTKL